MMGVHMLTPLPWRITEPNEKKGPREIVGANGSTVARLTPLDMANAEIIVVSVNQVFAASQHTTTGEST